MVGMSFAVFVLACHYFVPVISVWCSSKGDCSYDRICCNNQCVRASSCCTSLSDCNIGEICCYGACTDSSDCLGFSCYSALDCGQLNLSCCNGKCQYDCYDWTAIILGLIFGSLSVIFIIAMCVFCACRRQRRLHPGRVIVGRRVTTTTTRTSLPQCTQPYHSLPYQQGYAYYPPPQYEQHQANRPPPYNPRPSAASGQPPPYAEEPQETAGRVYTPKPSYGAVASAPPV